MAGPILPEHLSGEVPYLDRHGKAISLVTLKALAAGHAKRKSRWLPGTSGNPHGRPVGATTLVSILRGLMDLRVRKLFDAKKLDPNVPSSFLNKDIATALLETAIKQALKGDMTTLFELWDRLEPKTQKFQIQGGLGVVTRTPDEMMAALREANGLPPAEPAKALTDVKPS